MKQEVLDHGSAWEPELLVSLSCPLYISMWHLVGTASRLLWARWAADDKHIKTVYEQEDDFLYCLQTGYSTN